MKQQRVALASLVALAAVLAVWFLVFWNPEGSRLKAANQAQIAAKVAGQEAQLATLKADQPKLKAERAVLAKLVQAVPDGPALDQMLHTINAAALSAGVSLDLVGTPEPAGWGGSTGAAPATSGAQSLGLSLDVTGTQAHVLRFVTTLDRQPRLYVVSSFGLSTPQSGAGANVQSSFQVETYYVSASANNPTFPG
jgi:Tfp pilus assembly protein PilO